MRKICRNLTELIGSTPVLEATHIAEDEKLKATLLLKIEAFNPGGSAKDRAALAMIEKAEKDGLLLPGATIIEPTSGNTGVGLAWIASVKGYRVILTMPDTMSKERQALLRAYGADVVLTPGSEGMAGAIRKATELHEQTPDSFMPLQFDNPANPLAHRMTTGEEIWDQTDGKVDIFVAGVGTGGTVSGVGEALKAHKPDVEIVAVEPEDSPVLSGGKPGPHKIQGIGAGFVPANLNLRIIDMIMRVGNGEAAEYARKLARKEGVLAGISSGAALAAAVRLGRLPENEGKTIVALLPDTGERYLSTGLFDD